MRRRRGPGAMDGMNPMDGADKEWVFWSAPRHDSRRHFDLGIARDFGLPEDEEGRDDEFQD